MACLALIAAGGCGGGGGSTGPAAASPTTPVLNSIVVELPSITLVVGASASASATGLDQFGKPIATAPPVWSTGTPSVATISESGVVTAHTSGQTHVIASVGGREGRTTLTVVDVPVAGIAISPGRAALLLGTTRQLVVTLLDADGRALSGRPVLWSSSDSAKVTVSPGGIVTGVATGTVDVTASVGGKRATATIWVAAPGEVATIEVAARSANVVVGDTLQLTATLRDLEGKVLTGREVTWAASVVSGNGVATVSATGQVTTTSAGTVVVEAASGEQRGALAIVVRENIDESIVVTFANPLLNELVGDTLRIVVGVQSDRPLRDVVAVVENRRLALVRTPVGFPGTQFQWIGLMDVTYQTYGPAVLTVIATDDSGAIGVAAIAYMRDTRIGEVGGRLPPKNK